MIDLHSHVLPAVDDGPATLQDSLELARAAVAGGTRTMVATPHIDHHWHVDPRQLGPSIENLEVALAEQEIELEVLPGGEISLARLGELSEDELDLVALGGGPYLLVEAPLSPHAGEIEGLILSPRDAGREVLLAHPERCPSFQTSPERLEWLVRQGVRCQVTSGSMAGRFGDRVRRFTLELLRAGLVHDVASDTHHHERRRPDLLGGFAAAEEELPGISAQSDWLTREAPAAILAGTELPPRPPLPEAVRRRRRLPGLRRPRA